MAADELRLRPIINGVRFTTTSPRNTEHAVQWACGVVETITLDFGEKTVYKNEDADETVMICRRGSNAANEILERLAEFKQAKEDALETHALEQLPEVKRISDALSASMGFGVEQTIEIPEDTSPDDAATLPQLCGNPGAPKHFDCMFCDDPITKHPPRHFDTRFALAGHRRSAAHKKAEAAARPAAE